VSPGAQAHEVAANAKVTPAQASAANDGYHGRPVLKEPVWTWEIPLYFITGGIAGASSGLAFSAGLVGNETLAKRAQLTALGGVSVSPLLLISDLGRPARFLNMLRMFKRTSPMSMGTWLLTANGAAITLASAGTITGRAPLATRLARGAAALLGLPLTTYTAVLIANTAVPLWHAGRHELPFIFGGSSTAGAGALATLIAPAQDAGQARRLAIAGTAIEAISSQVMEHRLGELARPLKRGRAGALAWAAKGLATGGAALLSYAEARLLTQSRAKERAKERATERARPRLMGARKARRLKAAQRAGGDLDAIARAGAAMVLAGEVLERWAIFRAGFQSARDPSYTIAPQRARLQGSS
jgi:formate-dependent nitrite reductase membrane component NrfD